MPHGSRKGWNTRLCKTQRNSLKQSPGRSPIGARSQTGPYQMAEVSSRRSWQDPKGQMNTQMGGLGPGTTVKWNKHVHP